MNCADIDELSPLWHTGELEACQHADFKAHVAACTRCAADLRDQRACDVRLKDAMAAESTGESSIVHNLRKRVVQQIAVDRSRRWLWPAVAATAAAAATLLVMIPHRAPVSPAIFADAARDHTIEVTKQAPRHWRTGPVEIAALEVSQGISGTDVKAVEATGYRLQRAKICRLAGKPYMHLVFAKDGREFSVYMRVKGNESIAESQWTAGNLQLAAFSQGRVQAVIVTDAPRDDCEQFAREAESAL